MFTIYCVGDSNEVGWHQASVILKPRAAMYYVCQPHTTCLTN